MGGAIISARVEDREVRDLFARLKERGKDFTPVMKVIGELIRTSVVRNFEEGGRPEKWKPLSIATLFAGKKSRFVTSGGRFRKGKTGVEARPKGRKTLIDSARLLNSISARAFGDRAEVGTNVVYAAVHQFGGMAGRGRKVNIPARPFLMVQDQDMTEIRKTLLRHIMAADKGG